MWVERDIVHEQPYIVSAEFGRKGECKARWWGFHQHGRQHILHARDVEEIVALASAQDTGRPRRRALPHTKKEASILCNGVF